MLNFKQYTDMTECWIGNNVVLSTNNFSNAFNGMSQNLTIVSFNHPELVNISSTYRNCHSLTGSPACGDKVTDMY